MMILDDNFSMGNNAQANLALIAPLKRNVAKR
jgi:hypothetical protein